MKVLQILNDPFGWIFFCVAWNFIFCIFKFWVFFLICVFVFRIGMQVWRLHTLDWIINQPSRFAFVFILRFSVYFLKNIFIFFFKIVATERTTLNDLYLIFLFYFVHWFYFNWYFIYSFHYYYFFIIFFFFILYFLLTFFFCFFSIEK